MKNNNLFFQVIMIFLISGIILFYSFPTYAQDPVEEARKNVVCIVVKDASGITLGWGSGFVIGLDEPYEHVVTNWHLVDPDRYDVNRIDAFIWISSDDLVPARVYHQLKETDIAILKIDPEHLLYGFIPLELANRDLITIGEAVYAIGFPDGEITDFHTAYYTDTTVTKGILNEVTSWNDTTAVYQTNAAINPGNSGGPLLNENGQVVGINTYAMLEETGINGAVHIDYLTEALHRRDIPFKAADEAVTENNDNNEEDEDESDYLLIGGVVAGLFVLLAIFLTIKLPGRRRKPTLKPSPSGAVKPPADSTSDAWARTQAAPTPKVKRRDASADDYKNQKQPRPILKGITGHFAGIIVDFVEGHLVIGRDPRLAQLIYPQNNTDISRKHCTIRFDEKTFKFIIEDTSSNGTFLSSNQKLESGKPYYLNSGERFYLAKPGEVFEVKLES